MTFKNIDFKSGIIVYNDLDIDLDKPLSKQTTHLDEDMLQVKYPLNYTLDIGWYGDVKCEGKFVLQLIKNCDWDNPIYKKATMDLNRLEKYLQECIDLVEKLIKKGSSEALDEPTNKCDH